MCSQLAQPYSAFRTSVERTDREIVLLVGGDLDMAVAPLLGAAVRDACSHSTPAVVVEAQGVTFVDAAGLRGLLGGYRPEVVAKVRVRNPSPVVVRLLDLVGMLHVVEDCPR